MSNVVALPRRRRSADIVDEATAAGAPLPLHVMLVNLRYWHTEAERLTKSKDLSDIPLARMARAQAQRAATDAAPYVHAKLSNTIVSGDEEAPLTVQHERLLRFDRLTDQRATELLEALESGTMTLDDVNAEIA
jgi:hypothetical protein